MSTTKKTWSRARANEYIRLFQGVEKNRDRTQHIMGPTCVIGIWPQSQVQKEKMVIYLCTVVDIRSEKKDPNRVWIIARRNRLEYYNSELSTETASIEMTNFFSSTMYYQHWMQNLCQLIYQIYIYIYIYIFFFFSICIIFNIFLLFLSFCSIFFTA